jgi:hypothetical protein
MLSEAKSVEAGTVSNKERGEEHDEGDVGGETGGSSARASSKPRHGTSLVMARGH